LSFGPNKNGKNIAERGLSFERVAELEWEDALSVEDRRKDDSERRLQVTALFAGRSHVGVITLRGDAVHVISFRKANRKEVKFDEQEKGRSGLTARS